MKRSDNFAIYLTKFFSEHLPAQRNLSHNTICSYRDTFVGLIKYFQYTRNIPPDKLTISCLKHDVIEAYLSHIETVLHNSICTRNQRLSAIKSFMKYIQVEEPEHLQLCQTILSISSKKAEKPIIEYLTSDEIQLLLNQPDTSVRKGRRDLALLSLLYDSAARVQELCDIKVKDIRIDESPVIRLYGKGRKSRSIPITMKCAKILRGYMMENQLNRTEFQTFPLFFNNRNEKLTRSGVSYILNKYMNKLSETGELVPIKKITPHCLRHSKAMHMVEAGINLIYIRDFLGHESIETTQIYTKANPEVKRKMFQMMNSLDNSPQMPDWNDNPNILQYLKNL